MLRSMAWFALAMAVVRQVVIRASCFPTVALMDSGPGLVEPAMMHNHKMVALFPSLLGALRSSLRTRADLALENLALHQLLANLRRTSGCPYAQERPRLLARALPALVSVGRARPRLRPHLPPRIGRPTARMKG